MLTIKAMSDGSGYAAHHLSNNDYYSVGETIEGRWMGRGAELLGLEGGVKLEDFEAIRLGNDPLTGEFLRQRQSADRYNSEGHKISTGQNLYDFTLSAPKAVSVQALVDSRLIQAHNIAVTETTIEMERLAGTRVRRACLNEDRNTSNLVIARYDHDTSRELDPQLHSHLVAGNITYDAVEGRWKALQATLIYEQREYLTEVYRNSLAREVMKLGYQVEDRFEHGKDLGFKIVGIEESTLEKYSQRSAQRDKAIAEFLELNGRLPSNNEIARLVRDTRPEKLAEITSSQVKAQQFSRMTTEEAKTLRSLRQVAQESGSIREQAPADLSLVHAAEHIFERVSVAKEYVLKTEALRHGRGRIELPELKAAVLSEVATGVMLSAKGELATLDSLARERRMISMISEASGAFEALGRSQEFVVSDRLRPEQKHAVESILCSRDFATNLRGAAGTGKTQILRELHRGLNEARRSVVAVAPTASAVEELQKVGFPGAKTVARFLADPKGKEQLAGQVLVIDEAGMVSSRDMVDLLSLAKNKAARVVFSGDTSQIKSVTEGDALRVLERESNLKSVSLLQVQRQITAEYKEVVETLRTCPGEGFIKLEEMGAIREVDWRLRAQAVNRAYREAAAVPNVKGEKRSVLVIAATHDEIKSITHAIRQDKQRRGELEPGETFVKHSALNWTEAQKKQLKNYQPGQILEFHGGMRGVKKNEALEVLSADTTGVKVRNVAGRELIIKAGHVKNFSVFERQDIDISPGDKLLLQANWRDKSFRATNGELVTVSGIANGILKLQDGREIPASYRQFSHGYAVTPHRSQGKTVDFQVIAADQMNGDLFYVSTTRGREGITVITSDTLALQESIGITGERQSASELARRTESLVLDFKSDEDFHIRETWHQLARHTESPARVLRNEDLHMREEQYQIASRPRQTRELTSEKQIAEQERHVEHSNFNLSM